MDFVNINSLQRHTTLPPVESELLLRQFGPTTPEDQLIVTDRLELLRGSELVEAAHSRGQVLLPARRVCVERPSKGFPRRVLLELTSTCNSHCAMCPRHMLTRPEQHMETALAKDVIRQAGEAGVNGLWLYYLGEALLHPDIFDIIDYTGKYTTLGTIWLSTNGHELDERAAARLLDSPVTILNYSVNAMSEEQYRKITTRLDFATVQGNLRRLAELKRQKAARTPVIRAQMIELPHVLHEIEQFKAEFGPLVDIISVIKHELFTQKNENYAGQIQRNTGIWRCNRLEREDFFVFSNGEVTCCDTDVNASFALGNAREQSIQEIYDGQPYRALMREYRDGRLHERAVCSLCRDYSL